MKRLTLQLLFCTCFFFATACGMEPGAARSAQQVPAVALEREISVQAEATETPVPVPTVPPTPVSTPTPLPISDEALNSGALDAFFDDSVMIGDSLTAGFAPYVLARRDGDVKTCLGKMRFAFASAFYLERAYWGEIGEYMPALKYRGLHQPISDIVGSMEAKRIFILLGVDDVSKRSIEDNMTYMRKLIGFIQEKNPDLAIVVQSIPPVLETYAEQLGNYGPELNEETNAALQSLCEELGVEYLELAAYVRDPYGYLDPIYCCDTKFHFNNQGKARWLQQLRKYAKSQYDQGLWSPDV